MPKIETGTGESQDEDELTHSTSEGKRKDVSPDLGGPVPIAKDNVVQGEDEDEVMQDVEGTAAHNDNEVTGRPVASAGRDHCADSLARTGEASPPPPATTAALAPPPVPTAPTHRAKHPNQYTYRPKNGQPAASSAPNAPGAKRSPTKPSTAKGAAGKDKGAVNPSASSTTSSTVKDVPALVLGEKEREKLQWAAELGIHLSWAIPEHLKHLSHLLPSPLPEPINVPTSTSTGGGGGGNSKGGAAASEGTTLYQEYQDQFIQATSNASADPSAAASSATVPDHGLFSTHYEPPTKVRFPGKRVTMPEMKKRVRSLAEYLERVRQEVHDREKKDEVLRRAIEANKSRTTAAGAGHNPSSSSVSASSRSGGSKETSPPPATTKEGAALGTSAISENTLAFMETLSRELVMFRERFDS